MREALLDRYVTIKRRTSDVLPATTASANMAPTRQPVRESILEVVVAGGTTGSGTVTITGTVNGVAGVSEALTFSANGTRVTAKRFTSVSAIATSGLSDETAPPTVQIRAVSPGGTPQAAEYDLAQQIPAAHGNVGRPAWNGTPPQPQEADEALWSLVYYDAWQPRVGDVLSEDDSGETWDVLGTRRVGPRVGSWFWELRCRRRTTA